MARQPGRGDRPARARARSLPEAGRQDARRPARARPLRRLLRQGRPRGLGRLDREGRAAAGRNARVGRPRLPRALPRAEQARHGHAGVHRLRGGRACDRDEVREPRPRSAGDHGQRPRPGHARRRDRGARAPRRGDRGRDQRRAAAVLHRDRLLRHDHLLQRARRLSASGRVDGGGEPLGGRDGRDRIPGRMPSPPGDDQAAPGRLARRRGAGGAGLSGAAGIRRLDDRGRLLRDRRDPPAPRGFRGGRGVVPPVEGMGPRPAARARAPAAGAGQGGRGRFRDHAGDGHRNRPDRDDPAASGADRDRAGRRRPHDRAHGRGRVGGADRAGQGRRGAHAGVPGQRLHGLGPDRPCRGRRRGGGQAARARGRALARHRDPVRDRRGADAPRARAAQGRRRGRCRRGADRGPLDVPAARRRARRPTRVRAPRRGSGHADVHVHGHRRLRPNSPRRSARRSGRSCSPGTTARSASCSRRRAAT